MPHKRPSRVQQQRDEAFRAWLRREEEKTAGEQKPAPPKQVDNAVG